MDNETIAHLMHEVLEAQVPLDEVDANTSDVAESSAAATKVDVAQDSDDIEENDARVVRNMNAGITFVMHNKQTDHYERYNKYSDLASIPIFTSDLTIKYRVKHTKVIRAGKPLVPVKDTDDCELIFNKYIDAEAMNKLEFKRINNAWCYVYDESITFRSLIAIEEFCLDKIYSTVPQELRQYIPPRNLAQHMKVVSPDTTPHGKQLNFWLDAHVDVVFRKSTWRDVSYKVFYDMIRNSLKPHLSWPKVGQDPASRNNMTSSLMLYMGVPENEVPAFDEPVPEPAAEPVVPTMDDRQRKRARIYEAMDVMDAEEDRSKRRKIRANAMIEECRKEIAEADEAFNAARSAFMKIVQG